MLVQFAESRPKETRRALSHVIDRSKSHLRARPPREKIPEAKIFELCCEMTMS